MSFSKDIKQLALLSALALLLVACGGAPKRDGGSDDAGDAAAQAESQEGEPLAPEEPFVLIAKPDSASAVAVPQQARNDFAYAQQLMAGKRWQEAEKTLLVMSETYPQLSGVYVNLGIVYEQLERYEDAEQAYNFAINSNAHNFDAYTNLGVLYRELGKFKQAESTYLAAIALWPHHYDSRLNLGILYDLYLGQNENALEHYRIAQKIEGGENRQLKGWIVELERRTDR